VSQTAVARAREAPLGATARSHTSAMEAPSESLLTVVMAPPTVPPSAKYSPSRAAMTTPKGVPTAECGARHSRPASNVVAVKPVAVPGPMMSSAPLP
jgi:hypothetical protein